VLSNIDLPISKTSHTNVVGGGLAESTTPHTPSDCVQC